MDRRGRASARREPPSTRRRRRGWRRPTSPPTWSSSSRSCRGRWAASTRARKASPSRCGRPSTITTCRSASRRMRRPRSEQLGDGGGHVGGGVARRQAGHARVVVQRRREADRVARSVRAAAPDARPGEGAGGSAGADRRRSRHRLGAGGRPWRGGGAALAAFMLERVRYVLEQRGFEARNVRAVTHGDIGSRESARRAPGARSAAGVHDLGRSSRSSRRRSSASATSPGVAGRGSARISRALTEPAEEALLPGARTASAGDRGGRRRAATIAAGSPKRRIRPGRRQVLHGRVRHGRRPALRTARLTLMKRLETLILRLGDIWEIVAEKQA